MTDVHVGRGRDSGSMRGQTVPDTLEQERDM